MLDTVWSPEQLLERSRAIEEQLIEWRRWMHLHPELSFQEKNTAQFIAGQLAKMGYEPHTGVGTPDEGYVIPEGGELHGVIAVLNEEKPGPAVAIRADFDALPLSEVTGLSYAAAGPVMHACGHDAHTTILLGVASLLREISDQLPGPVVLIFQPAEEMPPGGARAMIAAGILQEYNVGAVFGLHQMPQFDVGTMSFHSGPTLASADFFTLVVRGPGGHAAMPHTTIDIVLVAAEIITALHTIVSRQVSPLDSAVVTVGSIHGGQANNVIPAEVELKGTVRTLNPKVHEVVPQRIKQIAEHIAAAYGASVELNYGYGYPVVVNNEEMTRLGRRAAARLLGEENVHEAQPIMGGDDFAYFLQQVPGTYAFLGSGIPDIPSHQRYPVHSPKFCLDERVLSIGVAYFISVIQEYFARDES